MLFKEIVQKISQQAGVRVGVGVLVEYPHSRPRQKVLGTLLGKWGRQHTAPYNVRKASVVLLVDGHQHRTTTVFSAVPIRWKGWWRVRFANRPIDGCEFVRQDEQIQVCRQRDDGRYVGGQLSDFYVLDLGVQTLDVFGVMAYAKALSKSLINSGFDVEDLKFLATCDDLEWLAIRYPRYVPKLLQHMVISLQKDEGEDDIERIENEIRLIRLKSELEQKENDSLEAKDRSRPWLRWWWKTLHIIYSSSLDIVPIFKVIVTIFLLGVWLAVIDQIQPDVLGDYTTTGIVFYTILLIWRGFKIFNILTRWSEKYFIRFSQIEESRDRRTKEHYQNRQMT